MDSTHIRWLEESLEKQTVQKILKAENGRIRKEKESMTEKRNQKELLWFQTGGALNFITAAGVSSQFPAQKAYNQELKFSLADDFSSSVESAM
jgi:hypothetical protein